MHPNAASAFVASFRLCGVGWSSLGNQSWFPYEYDDGVLIIFEGAESLNCVLLDQTKGWGDGGDEIYPIYCKEYESRKMTENFEKVLCL